MTTGKRHWSGDTKAKVRELVKAGWSDRRIADALGRSESTVRAHRQLFGLAGNRERRRWTADEAARCVRLAKECGIRKAAVILGRSVAAVHSILAVLRRNGGDQ